MSSRAQDGHTAGVAGPDRAAAAAVVTGLVIAAAWVRSGELAPPSLWSDDAWVAVISRHDWRDIWFTSYTAVGFRALIGAVIAAFGDAPLVAQLPAFALGLLAIPATYRVARVFTMHRLAALFAAGLVAASPLLATYSTRVKQYTSDAVLTLALAAAVAGVLERPGDARRWWTFAGVGAGAVVFSGQLVLPLAAAVAVVVAGAWRARRAWSGAAGPAMLGLVAFAAAWYAAVLAPVITPALSRFWAERYIDLGLDEGSRAGAQSLGVGVYRLLDGTIGGAPVQVAGAAVLFAAALVRRRGLALALLLPVLGAIAAAVLGRAPIGARPDAYLAPVIALLLAAGLDGWLRWRPAPGRARVPRAAAWVALALAAAVLVGAPGRAVPEPYPAHDVRSVTRIWASARRPDDRTLVHAAAAHAFALYSGEALVTRRAGRRLMHATVDHPRIAVLPWRLRHRPREYPAAVEAALPDGTERVWLLTAHDRRGDLPVLKDAVVARGFGLEQRWTTEGTAELSLYRRVAGR